MASCALQRYSPVISEILYSKTDPKAHCSLPEGEQAVRDVCSGQSHPWGELSFLPRQDSLRDLVVRSRI